MDFALPDELEKLRLEAEEVAVAAAADLEIKEDSWINSHDRAFSEELGDRGWLGMTWPKEYGGGERTALERFLVFEAMIANGAPIAATWFCDRQMGPSLLAFGTEDQKRRFLPDMIAGKAAWCIGMSEPDSGSDLASLRTRAERDGDDFVINGQKVWTSFAALADYCYLICRTNPEGKAHQGLSELIVPMDTPGIEVRPITDMTTNSHFCEVMFDDVRVPASNLVGELNGSWKQTMSQLEHERGGIDRLLSNRALYRDSLPRADMADPRIRQEVAALESFYRIGRHLILREVLGQAPKGWSALTKTAATTFEQRVAEFCARVHGPETMLWNRVSRAVCYAPAYTIMGGTNNVLRNIIGDRMLGLPRG
ncbi:MAG TPA: acyl-CoA dehydrogenase family protein [Acidimicrobiales bacterium]|nr:acyl-CoA dehydrogenase family protein [Acidimicrobiales bacterium]